MADVFISYKRGADEPLIEAMVGGLRANGYSVWWDRDIPTGAPWEETILSELHGAKLAIVCWSKDGVNSENVRSEARYAKERDKLVQLFVSPCQPPLFFGENQGLKIEEVAEVYGPRFQAVLDAVRERLGEIAAPPKPNKTDPAVRAWRRNEPRATWEPLQFGLSCSVLCVAILYGWLAIFGFPGRLLDMSRALGLSAVAVFLAAWLAYSLVVQQPRRIAVFRGTLVGLIAAAVAAACILAYEAIAPAIVGALSLGDLNDREISASMQLVPHLEDGAGVRFAIIVLVFTAIITRIWLPIFVRVLRPLLRNVVLRGAIAVVALIAPAIMVWAPFAPDRDTIARRAMEHQFVWAVAERGLETAAEARERALDPMGRPSPHTVRRVIEMFGSSADSMDLSAAALALGDANVPEKTEWVLAADGSGDAMTMQEILSRSAGTITIRVRQGVYGAETDWSDPGDDARAGPLPMSYQSKWRDGLNPNGNATPVGPLYAAARAMSRSRTHDIRLIGEPGAVFEETYAVTLPPYMRVEGLTLRFRRGSGHRVSLEYPSVMANVRIEILARDENYGIFESAGIAILGAERPQVNLDTGLLSTQLSGVTIITYGDPIVSGIDVHHGAVARIAGVEITGVRANSACIRIHATQNVTLRGNNLRACAPLNAIVASVPNTNLILDNAGARDTPVLELGAEQDFYRY